MADDVGEVIDALRLRLRAKSEADLARILKIGQSTISSWKMRGSVPLRFRRILSGDSELSIAVGPVYWSNEEMTALGLALTRYCRVNSESFIVNSFRDMLKMANHPYELWSLFRSAQAELSRRPEGEALSTALAAAIHQDCSNTREANRRDQEIMSSDRPSVELDDGTTIDL